MDVMRVDDGENAWASPLWLGGRNLTSRGSRERNHCSKVRRFQHLFKEPRGQQAHPSGLKALRRQSPGESLGVLQLKKEHHVDQMPPQPEVDGVVENVWMVG